MKEWFTASELADMTLPQMPATKRGIALRALAEGWSDADREWHEADNPHGTWRSRAGRGGSIEYHFSLLPAEAQAKIALAFAPAQQRPDTAGPTSEELWHWFDGLSESAKKKAQDRIASINAVEKIEAKGHSREFAIAMVARERKVSDRSIWRWFEQIAGVDRHDRLPVLAGRYGGGRAASDIDADAWEAFKADYLRLEAPTLTACYRRLVRIAKDKGWNVPTEKTLARRVERAISHTVQVLAREGVDALSRLYPPMERDRSVFHALEAINGDGHKWDVFVRFPDGTIDRPMMVAFQDLYSNKMVAWRIDRSENHEAIRLALGDVVEVFGLPKHIWFDNTRAFANKWLTGRAKHRYRFKIREEDPIGLCESMGIQVHFTKPYSGQSKPIERSFRDFAGDIAKHPAFAGAYVGNKPDAKPENYGKSAVLFDDFVRVIGEEIAEWNARAGRRTAIAKGRSFDDVFEESYQANINRIAKPSEAMARQWRLAADDVRVRPDGSINLMGNRFWQDFLSDRVGSKMVVRFDPQNIHAGLHIYEISGRYLGFAPVIEAAGFNSKTDAREHGRLRTGWMRAKKVQLKAELSMDALELAQKLPTPSTPTPPAADHTVIHHVFPTAGSAALAAQPIDRHEEEANKLAYLSQVTRGLKLLREEDDF